MQGDEFAIVENPAFIHPRLDFYPLAKKNLSSVPQIGAILMDMDGTTTTTEELCIHSLEMMIRRMSGLMGKDNWIGLDHSADYPHIIGNSTTKHVEYLCRKYHSLFRSDATIKAFLYSSLWTLLTGKDKQRREEVRNDVINIGLSSFFEDGRYVALINKNIIVESDIISAAESLFVRYGEKISALELPDYVRLGIDIYYQRYHEILERIKKGEGSLLSQELFANAEKHLIEPMPGVELFLPLVKGWFGSDARYLDKEILRSYEIKAGISYPHVGSNNFAESLARLSTKFSVNPAKVAIVTSSIFYEADIVVSEVFKILTTRIEKMPLPESRLHFLLEKFCSYQNYYDSFVTASDSNEIRLKPHRDLYSIALHQLGVTKEQFDSVVGFEDSESGTIAIRAAGIGRCVAVPFAQTNGHNFLAASHICKGGLPEVVLTHSVFTV